MRSSSSIIVKKRGVTGIKTSTVTSLATREELNYICLVQRLADFSYEQCWHIFR
jgi:hypothetical protein